MSKKKLRIIILSAIVLVSVTADQSTKYFARESLKEKGTVQVLGDFFILHYTENSGAFLGMGSKWPVALKKVIFSILSLLLVIGIVVFALRGKNMEITDTVGMALIIGGGIGNLVDRLLRGGSVTDFMNMGVGKLRTGIFNFADLFLIAGVITFAIAQMRRKNEGG